MCGLFEILCAGAATGSQLASDGEGSEAAPPAKKRGRRSAKTELGRKKVKDEKKTAKREAKKEAKKEAKRAKTEQGKKGEEDEEPQVLGSSDEEARQPVKKKQVLVYVCAGPCKVRSDPPVLNLSDVSIVRGLPFELLRSYAVVHTVPEIYYHALYCYSDLFSETIRLSPLHNLVYLISSGHTPRRAVLPKRSMCSVR